MTGEEVERKIFTEWQVWRCRGKFLRNDS